MPRMCLSFDDLGNRAAQPLADTMTMDFPVTRETIDHAEQWVHELAKLLSPPVKVTVQGTFRWEHPERDASSAQVAKAVRAVSGLRGAMHLADLRHTAECATLLRTVADFSAEIEYLGEALLEGRLTDDQSRFVDQHFAPFPSDPDELAAREREYYIGRKDMAKARSRLFTKWGGDAKELDKIAAYLNKGYDSFVHGANGSAMELFTGRTTSFMLNGHESNRHICMAKASVAGKVKEFLNALRLMALSRHIEQMNNEIRAAFQKLDESGEDSVEGCAGLD